MIDITTKEKLAISTVSVTTASSVNTEHPLTNAPADLLKSQPTPRPSRCQRPEEALDILPTTSVSSLRQIAIILQLSGINLCSSASHGLIVIGLPTITKDISLHSALALWPISSTSLGTATTLLLAGVLADTLGPRPVDLLGCFIISAFMLGSAFANDGVQMVAMRAIQGIGIALHFSSSVALVVQAFPKGRRRNLAFSCLGLSQPLGFAFGLVIGGLIMGAVGWRVAWYMFSGLSMALFLFGVWVLPRREDGFGFWKRLQSCGKKADWVGALLASGFMAASCYLLAIISADTSSIHNVDAIVLLCIAITLIPCFIFWMHRRTSRSRPALIPNSMWRDLAFTSVCGITALSFSVVNAIELFSSLYFQEIQHLDGVQSSIRIVPSLLVGVLVGLCCGLLVDRFPAVWLIGVSSAITALSPVIMATIPPEWSYWQGAFGAQLLCPVAADILFTVGLSIISDVFPDDMQALAGAVFNTSSQFGTALGLAILQIVSQSVAKEHGGELLIGYRASFWCLFGFMISCVIISVLGLRSAGKTVINEATVEEDSEWGLTEINGYR